MVESVPPKDEGEVVDIASDESPDVSRKVKRKPSRPTHSEKDVVSHVQIEEEKANGHVSGEGKGDQQLQRDVDLTVTTQQHPSAGAHDIPASPLQPSESDKPTVSTSTKASKSPKSPRKPQRSFPLRQQKKTSFWSKFFHGLLPCIGASKAHPTDIDSAAPLREKQRDPDLEKVDADTEERLSEKKDKAQEASSSHDHTAEPPTVITAPLTISSQPPILLPPTPTSDPAVIIPPSPKSHRLPRDETEGVTSGAVQPPGSTGTKEPESGVVHQRTHDEESERTDSSSFTDDDERERGVLSSGAGAGIHEEDLEDEDDRLIFNGGAGIPIGPDGIPRPLLPVVATHHAGRKCLVLDLDETLVHSSFKLIPQADYVVPVEIEWQWHNVYVIKRPGVDNFLKQMGELYEIVVFTASLSKYADPVLDKLDVHKVVSHRLFRESCYNHKGNYVKDLSQLGRPITDTIILDNSPASYIFHPNNAVPVSSWFNDPHDTELTDLCPFLADLRTVDDVRGVLDGGL